MIRAEPTAGEKIVPGATDRRTSIPLEKVLEHRQAIRRAGGKFIVEPSQAGRDFFLNKTIDGAAPFWDTQTIFHRKLIQRTNRKADKPHTQTRRLT